MTNVITIDQQGAVQFIYDDDLAVLLDEGEAQIRRASHVEPTGTAWTADMSPVAGPVLGPFPSRSQALAAEVAWLRENYL